MAEETKIETTEVEQKSRRTFVTTAAQVAVTAPAVGLLLSASSVPAAAAISINYASAQHILDDFTSGNTHEDVDAHTFGSNFNNYNGVANQDDVFVPADDATDLGGLGDPGGIFPV